MSFYFPLKTLGALPLPPPDMCRYLDFSDGGLLPPETNGSQFDKSILPKECAHRGVVISTYVPTSNSGSKPNPQKRSRFTSPAG